MIVYERESAAEFYKNANYLFHENWEETIFYSDIFPVNIDVSYFLNMERLGRFLALSAKDQDKTIGYIVWLIHKSTQSQVLCATCAVLFVKKSYRKIYDGKWVWKELFERSKDFLRESGIHRLRVSSTSKKNISPILKRIGLKKEEDIYGMLI